VVTEEDLSNIASQRVRRRSRSESVGSATGDDPHRQSAIQRDVTRRYSRLGVGNDGRCAGEMARELVAAV
jgi:hypothetical protein